MSGCITCSDEGIPMRLSAAPEDGLATCFDEHGNASEVMTGLVEPIGRDEWVLVHAGTALIKIAGPASVSPGGNA
jgi:hydrogenase maturation factor